MSCKQEGKVQREAIFPCLTLPTPTKAVSFAAWLEYCLCKTCKAVLHAWKQSIRRGTITHMWGRPQTQKSDVQFRLAKLLHFAEIECKCTGCKQFVNVYRMWWWCTLPNFGMDCTEPDYCWVYICVYDVYKRQLHLKKSKGLFAHPFVQTSVAPLCDLVPPSCRLPRISVHVRVWLWGVKTAQKWRWFSIPRSSSKRWVRLPRISSLFHHMLSYDIVYVSCSMISTRTAWVLGVGLFHNDFWTWTMEVTQIRYCTSWNRQVANEIAKQGRHNSASQFPTSFDPQVLQDSDEMRLIGSLVSLGHPTFNLSTFRWCCTKVTCSQLGERNHFLVRHHIRRFGMEFV